MGLIVKLPKSETGRDSVVVFVDKLSKMAHIVACNEDDGALEMAQYLIDTVFRLHGMPKTLVSDRDTRFTSTLYKELCRIVAGRGVAALHPA